MSCDVVVYASCWVSLLDVDGPAQLHSGHSTKQLRSHVLRSCRDKAHSDYTKIQFFQVLSFTWSRAQYWGYTQKRYLLPL